MTAFHITPLWRVLPIIALSFAHPDMTAGASLRESIDLAHEQIWKRFMQEDGTILDYADRQGKVILPTAEQCNQNMPNALGWWSPIENGSFYAGVYMDGIVGRWESTKDPGAAIQAQKLARGLERLATAGSTPAFIARGFASDGKTVYPASSDDQSYPWFYGIWRYLKSGIPDDNEKARLGKLMEKLASEFEAIHWQIPSNRADFGFFGGWDGDHCDANARLLFIIRATYDITGNQKWHDLYLKKSQEKRGKEGKSRIDLIAEGSHYVAPGTTPSYPMNPPIWTSASTQAAVRALRDWETDAANRGKFESALQKNAQNAAAYLAQAERYNPEEANTMSFDINWEPLNDPKNGWAPQKNVREGIKVGSNQWTPWKKLSPRRIYENDYVRDPLCAFWIISLSDDPALRDKAKEKFASVSDHYRWDEMFTVSMFWAENAYWRLMP